MSLVPARKENEELITVIKQKYVPYKRRSKSLRNVLFVAQN